MDLHLQNVKSIWSSLVLFNTYLSQGSALPWLATAYLNSCISPLINICKLQKGCSSISKASLIQILIEVGILMTDALLVHMLPYLAPLQPVGCLRSNAQWLAPPLMPSTEPLPMLLLRLSGFSILSKNSDSSFQNAPTICSDNFGATFLCLNSAFHKRMKHLNLDYHFVWNRVQAKSFTLHHVQSSQHLADTLIKIVPAASFHSHQSKILQGCTMEK